jgi:elongation factor 1-alpha
MVLADRDLEPEPVWSFEAEVLILSHPTRVASGYEPIVHCHTISQSARMEVLGKEYLKPGEQGRARFSFKYRPEFLRPGDVFVLREGRVKGIGRVTSVG